MDLECGCIRIGYNVVSVYWFVTVPTGGSSTTGTGSDSSGRDWLMFVVYSVCAF